MIALQEIINHTHKSIVFFGIDVFLFLLFRVVFSVLFGLGDIETHADMQP